MRLFTPRSRLLPSFPIMPRHPRIILFSHPMMRSAVASGTRGIDSVGWLRPIQLLTPGFADFSATFLLAYGKNFQEVPLEVS